MKKIVVSIAIVVVVTAVMPSPQSPAQQTVAPPGIALGLTLNRSTYLFDDPTDKIQILIAVSNVTGGNVFASQGLSSYPFELALTFIDPDGKPITASQFGGGHHEGPIPQSFFVNGTPVQVDPIEILPQGYVLQVTIVDARTAYSLMKPGKYTVKATAPVRTYPSIFQTVAAVNYGKLSEPNFAGAIQSSTIAFALVTDADHDGYAYPVADSRISSHTQPDCNDADSAVNPGAVEIPGNGIDDDCNPATRDSIVIAPANINVTAEKHTIGPGNSSAVKKSPFSSLPIHVFEAAGTCVSRLGTGKQQFRSVWLSCPPKYLGTTNTAGKLALKVAPGNYLVLGEYDPTSSAPESGDEIYDGGTTGTLASGGTAQEDLIILVKLQK